MRKTIATLISVMTFLLCHAAETPHKQVLVFRNSGEVNLFYADSIQSIAIEHNDSLGLCQVFTTHGHTVCPIPVAEIDSVAFGSRNKSEFKSGVRILKDDVDIPAISAFDGQSLTYRSDAAPAVIPTSGELLYYGHITDLLPVGVCARVTSVTKDGAGHRVGIESVDPSEVFSEFFYAGDSSDPEVQQITRSLLRIKDCSHHVGDIKASTNGFSAGISLDVEFTNMVFSVMRHYYHVKCALKPKAEIEFNFKLDNTESIDEKYMEKTASLAPIAGIFVPSFDMAAFLKIDASLKFKYQMLRQVSLVYEWTRQKGVNTFSTPNLTDDNPDGGTNEAKMQLQLKGSIFAGLEVAARFGLIGDVGGAGVKVNAGPRFTGELGIGVLQDLSKEYTPELYAKGKIAFSLGVEVQPFAYYKKFHNILGGSYETTPLGSPFSLDFMKKELNLFPEFERTTGIAVSTESVVSRTEVSTPIEYPVSVGFTVEADEEAEEPLTTAFLDEVLEACNDEPVGLAYDFEPGSIPQNVTERMVVRPVFKYDNFTIKAAPSCVSKNQFYGYFAHLSGSSASLTGGAFDVRSKTADGTCVLIGNYFPRLRQNPLFAFSGGVGVVIGSTELKASLIGTWADELTTLVFNQDGSGSLNDTPFTYTLNSPQAGNVRLKFTDADTPSVTYTIIDLTPNALSLKKKGKSATHTLTRK